MHDFNNLLSPIARSLRQKKINKEISELNDTVDEMDFIDIHRIFSQQLQNTRSSQQPMKQSPK
jgi:hypothetical protein